MTKMDPLGRKDDQEEKETRYHRHQHFLRTRTLFSSSSALSMTTSSNIPMFFIHIPSVSQIFEAARGKDIQ